MRIAVGSEHSLVTCARSKNTMGLLEGSLGACRAAVAAQTSSTQHATRTVPPQGAPGTRGRSGPRGGRVPRRRPGSPFSYFCQVSLDPMDL